MHLLQLSHQIVLCYAPLSSSIPSHISTYCLLCVVSAFQRGAMKPYTCAIMTSESLGDEFTFVMWNSAHVWQGKSSVKESATQVRRAFSCCCSAPTVLFLFCSLLLLEWWEWNPIRWCIHGNLKQYALPQTVKLNWTFLLISYISGRHCAMVYIIYNSYIDPKDGEQ